MAFDGIGLAYYRSFGSKMQYINDLGKVNIIIGKNNSGKSNILRFLKKFQLSGWSRNNFDDKLDLNSIDGDSIIELAIQVKKSSENTGCFYEKILELLPDLQHRIPEWKDSFWISYYIDLSDNSSPEHPKFDSIKEQIKKAYTMDEIKDIVLSKLAYAKERYDNNKKKNIDYEEEIDYEYEDSEDDLLNIIGWQFHILNGDYPVDVYLIDSYRKITSEETWESNGRGLISKLNKLKQPYWTNYEDKEIFVKINSFVKSILNTSNVEIDIPDSKDDLYISMDGKLLPLNSLGTGIHQVIIMAVACTLISNSVVCIEEPEIYLHPELQKKLIRYISENTNNQYIITSHSSAIFDCTGVNIYHCQITEGRTFCKKVLLHKDKCNILDDLGYKASDILQSNCIIWVEGPSDRIYINKWIGDKNSGLHEGTHYSIMFYGGKLLSHISVNSDNIKDFIDLCSINRNVAIIIDSDKTNENKNINDTKKRVRYEVVNCEGFTWITKGKEIENYISEDTFKQALAEVHGNKAVLKEYGQYRVITKYEKSGRECSIDKVAIARELSKEETDFSVLDLDKKVEELVSFIIKSNSSS